MRKLRLYIAQSLDGFIATKTGSVDWLSDPENPDIDLNAYGYLDFCNTIDTTIMGYNTYREILNFGIPFPYPDKKNYIFSRNHTKNDQNPVEFIAENPVNFTANLKKQAGKDIWLIGGGEINKLLLNAGLIDEIILSIKPIFLGEGIKLFADTIQSTLFKINTVNIFDKSIIQFEMIEKKQ